MELLAALRERRSIRKFKPTDVSQNIIMEILNDARWSPSWGNTQPWEFYVLTGKTLAKFKEMNLQKSAAGEAPASDVPMPENWPIVLKARYSEMSRILLTALGIQREDKESRNKFNQSMFALFDAPCLILACISREHPVEYQMLDIGLITQSICLLAHDRGLGTCIMAAAVRYPDAIRKIAAIPENKRIVAGVALGYPDPAYPLYKLQRKRADIAELVHLAE